MLIESKKLVAVVLNSLRRGETIKVRCWSGREGGRRGRPVHGDMRWRYELQVTRLRRLDPTCYLAGRMEKQDGQ